jgi:hypothetical protein
MKAMELPAGFGNLMLADIQEIGMPTPVSWWPQAPGWQLLLAVLALVFAVLVWRRISRWRKDAYRRLALRQLRRISGGQEAPASLPVLLKAVAIHAYPRAEVAALWGEKWLDFLDACCQQTPFSHSSRQLLLRLSYQDSEARADDAGMVALLGSAETWIRRHRAVVKHA